MAHKNYSQNEQALIEELYSLIRFIYRKKLAEDIITAFEDAFAGHETAEERIALCEHWIDFYRAYQYRKVMRRRRPTYEERMTPCTACGYPVSHRHHLWDIATHGENKVTVQLCANCHELHHLLYNTLAKDSEYSLKLVHHILFTCNLSPEVVQKIFGWCQATMRYEIENGWLEGYKLSERWIEEKLHWSEYLRRTYSAAS